MTGTTLHVATRDGLTFTEAMESAPDGFALLTTPWRYEIVTTDGARRSTPDGVFEARVFNEHTELRWLNDADSGRTVLLSENPAALPPAFARSEPLEAIGTLRGGYLLWGKAVQASDGWTTLSTEHIGSLRVPGVFGRGHHVALATCEYIARDPEHGNAYIAEERLLSFELSEPLRRENA
ncbi:type III-D CRISPR-associated protein Csx19 [Actinomadura decatromicini]|uniref:TIGR03984 family CRISPR-associated protein n=1 Tax=Actinomadura decatromicini TaxID=2604572 RepID=A0A5D3FZK5_9ACTN|nr:CRISPR-associated protein Csx19 [Actinomadura decatromicini]TYK52615.1 TIGR03984 family CRISPR-associated protein [Actinomadura decatromicini]